MSSGHASSTSIHYPRPPCHRPLHIPPIAPKRPSKHTARAPRHHYVSEEQNRIRESPGTRKDRKNKAMLQIPGTKKAKCTLYVVTMPERNRPTPSAEVKKGKMLLPKPTIRKQVLRKGNAVRRQNRIHDRNRVVGGYPRCRVCGGRVGDGLQPKLRCVLVQECRCRANGSGPVRAEGLSTSFRVYPVAGVPPSRVLRMKWCDRLSRAARASD